MNISTGEMDVDPVSIICGKVHIKIRPGKRGMKGLSILFDDKIREVDTNMSWEQAILSHFGVVVDASRFFVRNGSQAGNSNETPIVKHLLTEKISEWISDFKRARPFFTVFIMENESEHQEINGILMAGPSRDLPLLPSDIAMTATRPGDSRKFTTPQLTSERTAWSRIVYTDTDNSLPRMRAGHGRIDETDDLMSVDSNASQDSLCKELNAQGIPSGDLRTNFGFEKLCNSQLRLVKHELDELKKTNPQQWKKWTARAPNTCNFLRDHFNV